MGRALSVALFQSLPLLRKLLGRARGNSVFWKRRVSSAILLGIQWLWHTVWKRLLETRIQSEEKLMGGALPKMGVFGGAAS